MYVRDTNTAGMEVCLKLRILQMWGVFGNKCHKCGGMYVT